MAWTTPTWGSRTDGDILTAAQVNDLRDSLRALAGTDTGGAPRLVVAEQGSAPSTPASGDLAIYALTSDSRARIINDGGTVFALGTESGSFTPVITGSTGTAGAYAASTAVGRWYRTGDLVTFWAYVVLTSKGSWTGNLQVNTPAFTSVNTAGNFGPINVNFWANLAVSAVSCTGNVQVNSQIITIRINTAATASSRLGVMADIADTTQIMYSGSYQVA